MTYNGIDKGDIKLGCDYIKLENGGIHNCDDQSSSSSQDRNNNLNDDDDEIVAVVVDDIVGGGWIWSFWWWAKILLVLLFLALLGAVFFKWVGPFLMDKEIIPILIWERNTFSTLMLAFLVVGSLAIFPSILLPSTPSMWIAGMTFGYGFGFLMTIGAVAIGVSIPFFTGSLFYHKMHVWLERYPKKASLIKLAGEGDWFSQFRAVALIRISPFPYIVFNYCAVATDVKYGPYLLGTLIGMVPEIFVALYTGILIKTLADASNDRHTLSAPQIIFNVIGFCITLTTTVIVTIYAKRRLKQLQIEEELLLRFNPPLPHGSDAAVPSSI